MKKIAALILSVLLTVFFVIPVSASELPFTLSENEWELIKVTNEYRERKAIDPLCITKTLCEAANIRARELKTLFSHYRPDKKPWYSVLLDFGLIYDSYSFENIAKNYVSPQDVLFAWSNNEVSKLNLNSMDVSHIGVKSSDSYWDVIAISCQQISRLETSGLNYVHVKAGTSLDKYNLYANVNCPHGDSFLPLDNYNVSGYQNDEIGRQNVRVRYKNLISDFILINDYIDTPYDAWYYNAVLECSEKGFFSGIGNNTFGVNMPLTRAMFVTVLARVAGVDSSIYTQSSFSDVSSSAWYSPFAEWAYSNGITGGTGNGCFSPDKAITRQEICVMLYSYATRFNINIKPVYQLKIFTDSDIIANWAKDAIEYAQMRGLVSGLPDGSFQPTRTATRAEAAQIIYNFNELIS